MAGKGWFTYAKPDAAHKVALELCISSPACAPQQPTSRRGNQPQRSRWRAPVLLTLLLTRAADTPCLQPTSVDALLLDPTIHI
jgi:hypothetical protein